jgi:hypothetical protein
MQTSLNYITHKRIFQHPLGWVLHLDKELHKEMWLEKSFNKWGKDWGITDSDESSLEFQGFIP